jgi:hypothetical protein
MKLTGVKTYVVKTNPPNWGGILWFFVKLETDEGLRGGGKPPFFLVFSGLRTAMRKWCGKYSVLTSRIGTLSIGSRFTIFSIRD